MIHELLQEIGLSDKEATMYVTLLRHGTQSISYLAKKADFNRGTAYVILHSLLAKGLAVETVRANIQYFTALDPKSLLTYLDHRTGLIASQKDKIESVMSQLIAIKNPHTSQPKIRFFEGAEGARAVMEESLTSKDKTLRAFLSIADVADFMGAEYFADYTARRIKRGYTLSAIRTQGKDAEALGLDPRAKQYVTNRKQKREIRYLSDDLAFPVTIYLYDNKLAILSSKQENFALLIESKELAEMQKKIFTILWQSLATKR